MWHSRPALKNAPSSGCFCTSTLFQKGVLDRHGQKKTAAVVPAKRFKNARAIRNGRTPFHQKRTWTLKFGRSRRLTMAKKLALSGRADDRAPASSSIQHHELVGISPRDPQCSRKSHGTIELRPRNAEAIELSREKTKRRSQKKMIKAIPAIL